MPKSKIRKKETAKNNFILKVTHKDRNRMMTAYHEKRALFNLMDIEELKEIEEAGEFEETYTPEGSDIATKRTIKLSSTYRRALEHTLVMKKITKKTEDNKKAELENIDKQEAELAEKDLKEETDKPE